MTTISLVDPTIYDNDVDNPTDGELLRDDLNIIIAESNAKDATITSLSSDVDDLLTGNITITGNKTLSGTTTLSGTVNHTGNANFGVASDPTSTDGDIWYNTTTDFIKSKVNGTVVFIPGVATPASNAGKFITAVGGVFAWGSPVNSYACIVESQSAGTDGGTFTNGAWRTRVLNTEQSDPDAIVSITSNQFTLAAGTYRVQASVPGYQCGVHVAKLVNITDTADTIVGGVSASDNSVNIMTRSVIVGQFTIAGSKVFEIQHRCTSTKATDGLGKAANVGVAEIYTIVEIWKVA